MNKLIIIIIIIIIMIIILTPIFVSFLENMKILRSDFCSEFLFAMTVDECKFLFNFLNMLILASKC